MVDKTAIAQRKWLPAINDPIKLLEHLVHFLVGKSNSQMVMRALRTARWNVSRLGLVYARGELIFCGCACIRGVD
jgi:hypothetical protein